MDTSAMRNAKIAILIPVFNAGSLLAESVASVAAAGLPRDTYEIIVTDNASDDSGIALLPSFDTQGARIHVRRNGANLGRVQNWNCALAAAEEMGFGHALFLMAGDRLRDDSVLTLRELMLDAGAALGLASFEIVDEDLRPVRQARRIVWRAKGGISARRFLVQSFGIGGMLLAPLGANLYELGGPLLRFDPNDPTHTDMAATAAFLRASGRPLVYLDRPITQWRRRAGRFHSGMDLTQRLSRDMALIRSACNEADVAVDPRKIRCTFLLRIIFHAQGNIFSAWSRLQGIGCDSAPIHWSFLLAMLWRQLIHETPWQILD
jgi:glycosyltransferase involved in cell wall biosynthesis